MPDFQAVPHPDHQISFQRHGRELTRFHFAPSLDRPFLFPVRAASDRSLTRLGHPHDPVGHSHHNSVWLSHHDVRGVDFWRDTARGGTGRSVVRAVEELSDSASGCSVRARIEWIDVRDQQVLIVESREIACLPTPVDAGDKADWLLVVRSEFRPPGESSAVTLNQNPFGLIGVRVAKTIGVHDGGGRVLNSDGLVNEEAVFRKPARWVDYSGPVEPGATGGLTLMDHPDNPRHPARFHVRDDGWMGVCLTLEAPLTISQESPLRLAYGLWAHSGTPDTDACSTVWKHFAEMPASMGER